MKKNFKITASEIKRMVPDLGGAFATDMITVAGKKVDYMVRQPPDREGDSGWVFYGGGETQEYLDDSDNTSIYAVNTIANYDPEIIPFLTYPPGTEIERNANGKLEVMTKDVEKPSVVLLQPIDAGRIAATGNWSFEVTSRMLRRLDEESLVIWKPEFTIWLNAYTSDGKPISERLSGILGIKSQDAYDLQQEEKDGLLKLRYRLKETTEGKEQDSAYIIGLTDSHEIHMSIYFDSDEHLPEIDRIWESLASA
jgi:hypothetical protein